MSNRLKRKLGDLGVDTSSRKANESFCLIGTPLPPLEKSKDTGEFVPLWKQEVRDEKGRRRLHGAFTGGFSAGYFNTVGSKEGWAPSTFVSSRSDRAKSKVARPEDFMDEEDLQELRDSKQMVDTTDEMDLTAGMRLGKEDAETDSIAGALEASMLPAPQDSAGARILKKMGWKLGQGIGPRVSWQERKRQDAAAVRSHGAPEAGTVPEDDVEASKHTYARRDVPVLVVTRKDNSHGLGYRPGMSLNESLGEHGAGSSSGPNLAAGFGLGALNDADEDDLDVYDSGTTLSKRRTAYDGMDHDNDDRPSKAQNSSRMTASYQFFQDGKPVLPGFVLSDKPVAEDRWFPLPDPPQGWKPDPRRVWGKEKENQPSQPVAPPLPTHTGPGKWKTTITADNRGTILGETPLPSAPRSVFEYMSQKDAERIKNMAAGHSNLPSSHPPSSQLSPSGRIGVEIPPLDPLIAQSALQGFQPFANDPAKQARYTAYLQSQASPDSNIELKPLPGQDIPVFNKELSDYAKSAQIFKPMSGAMAGRFTSAAVVDMGPKIHEGLHMPSKEEIAKKEEEEKEKEKKEEEVSPKVHAARVGMYGPLTREVKPWQPAKLLCKRFGVKDPDVQPEVPEAGVGATQEADLQPEWEKVGFPDAAAAAAYGISEKSQKRDLANVGLGEDETQGQDILTYTKPSMDIFKAIFASDDEDSDDEEDAPLDKMDVDPIPQTDSIPDPDPAPPVPSTSQPVIPSGPVDLATFKPVFVPRGGKSKSEKKEKKEKKKEKKKVGLVSFAMDEGVEGGDDERSSKERPKKKKKRDKERDKESKDKKDEVDEDDMWVEKPPPAILNALSTDILKTTTEDDSSDPRSVKGRKRAVDFM
ncbi:hypothetical protein ONZ45_g8158 [Pleurotus djamor]|nr:hypothetical protein ONZ45_g8158 [Pleurotus djamor]